LEHAQNYEEAILFLTVFETKITVQNRTKNKHRASLLNDSSDLGEERMIHDTR
jgi:hypothetical protein